MEQFVGFLIALAVGIIISLLGYYLNMRSMRKDREHRDREQLSEAVHSVLAEVESDRSLAGIAKETLGRKRIMLPFSNSAWEYHRGRIFLLPSDVQNVLRQFYILIAEANEIVKLDSRLGYGKGYADSSYNEKTQDIVNKAEELIRALRGFLE